jgi:general secretion pathway protein G
MLLNNKRALFALAALTSMPLLSCETKHDLQRQQEAVLRNDLRMMREAIDNYTLDKQRPPQALQDLVAAGYLREIPVDPFTNQRDWTAQMDDVLISPQGTARGIINVSSSSTKHAGNGIPFNTW